MALIWKLGPQFCAAKKKSEVHPVQKLNRWRHQVELKTKLWVQFSFGDSSESEQKQLVLLKCNIKLRNFSNQRFLLFFRLFRPRWVLARFKSSYHPILSKEFTGYNSQLVLASTLAKALNVDFRNHFRKMMQSLRKISIPFENLKFFPMNLQTHLIIQLIREQVGLFYINLCIRMTLEWVCVITITENVFFVWKWSFFPSFSHLTHLKWFSFFKGKYFVSEITENKSSWKLELNRSWQRFLKVSLNLLYSYFLSFFILLCIYHLPFIFCVGEK